MGPQFALRRLVAPALALAAVIGAVAAQQEASPAAALPSKPGGLSAPAGPASPTARLRGQELTRLQAEAGGSPAGLGAFSASQPRVQAAVNETPGDRRTFWSFNFATQSYEQVNATLRLTSPRGLYFVADGQSVSDEQLSQLAPRWESIYSTTTQMYGEAPDVDRDSKVTLLLTDIKDAPNAPAPAPASFDFRHQAVTAVQSNQREIIMLDTAPTGPLSGDALGALAHELAVMINWNYHRSTVGQELWLLDGLGELARFRNGYGHSVSARFFTDPDRRLNRWKPGDDNRSAAYLFLLYYWEQFGDAGTNALVRNPGTDIDAVDNALQSLGRPERFAEVFQRWTVANFLDDLTVAGGLYAYRSLDLTLGEYDGVNTFPRAYRTTDYTVPATDTGRVNDLAARYFRLYGGQSVLHASFNGDNYSRFRLTLIASSSREFTGGNAVFPIPLNLAQDGGISLPDYGTAYSSVVLVVTDAGDFGAGTFRITATLGDTVPAPTPTATPYPAGGATPAATLPPAPPATATPFSPQPTPTRAPGQPTATPLPGWNAAPASCCTASVWTTTPEPSAADLLTFYGKLQDSGGNPVPAARMEVRLFFNGLAGPLCTSVTGGDGMASCSLLAAGQAEPGRVVPVTGTFITADGIRIAVRTQITLR